jgi:hypothetical protein
MEAEQRPEVRLLMTHPAVGLATILGKRELFGRVSKKKRSAKVEAHALRRSASTLLDCGALAAAVVIEGMTVCYESDQSLTTTACHDHASRRSAGRGCT